MRKVLLVSAAACFFVCINVNADEASMQQKINEQNEKIDGLTSVVEGLNDKIQSLEEIIKNKDSEDVNNTKTEKLIKDLAKIIDDLDNKCVKKDELKVILDKYKQSSEEKPAAIITGESSKLLEEAKVLFRNKEYKKAKENFLELDKQNYKTAIANYYLGEIAYYEKSNKDALYYYKKSAKLDNNASYMDTLLLHSGISLENTKDIAGAKRFYELIIEKYPQKPSAKLAQQRLEKLK